MGIILKYGHKDDEAVADANITTVENRSRVAFPPIQQQKAEGNRRKSALEMGTYVCVN